MKVAASIISGAIGIIILILAIVLGFVVFPKTVENKVKEELKLVRGSPTWDKWVDIVNPIYISFYIFHVRNPEGVEAGEKPDLEERGPYVYRERRRKIDPHTESCKETVTYVQNITYSFDQERSGKNSDQDLVNVVNVPFVSLVEGASRLMPTLVPVLGSILDKERMIIKNVKIADLLFDGWDTSNYDIPLIQPYLPAEFLEQINGGFAIFKGKEQYFPYEVYSGAMEGDHERFGQIKAWNNSERLSEFWKKDSECSKIEATDGSIFRPFLKEDDKIRIFDYNLCRALQLDWEEEVTVKGLKGYRFKPSKKTLQGAANNPDNDCYCREGRNKEDCADGVFDVSVCRHDAPVYLSTPYWLDGDQKFNNFSGLGEADREKHEIRVDIEPRTGLLLQARKRMQINVEVQPFQANQFYQLKGKYLFPFLWLDEEASICDLDVADIKNRIEKPIKAVIITRWVGIGVGAALVLLGIGIYLIGVRRRKTVTV